MNEPSFNIDTGRRSSATVNADLRDMIAVAEGAFSQQIEGNGNSFNFTDQGAVDASLSTGRAVVEANTTLGRDAINAGERAFDAGTETARLGIEAANESQRSTQAFSRNLFGRAATLAGNTVRNTVRVNADIANAAIDEGRRARRDALGANQRVTDRAISGVQSVANAAIDEGRRARRDALGANQRTITTAIDSVNRANNNTTRAVQNTFSGSLRFLRDAFAGTQEAFNSALASNERSQERAFSFGIEARRSPDESVNVASTQAAQSVSTTALVVGGVAIIAAVILTRN